MKMFDFVSVGGRRGLMDGHALVRAAQQEYAIPKQVTSLAMLMTKKIGGN